MNCGVEVIARSGVVELKKVKRLGKSGGFREVCAMVQDFGMTSEVLVKTNHWSDLVDVDVS